jgi:lysophospholipase
MKSDSVDRRRIPEGALLSRWHGPDGWDQRRLDWPQTEGRRGRGSLLFAGGRGDYIEKYLEAHGHWHGRGWNVTVFDWRGQGDSRGDIVGGHLESLDLLVADLATLIAEWRSHAPGPHVVVAHSMGGHVLRRALAERRPAIDAAVAVAPMVLINARPLSPRLARWLAGLLASLGLGRRPAWKTPRAALRPGSRRQRYLTSCAERYADELWWWEHDPGYDLGPPSWGWLRAAYLSSARLTPAALAGIDVPLLFLGTETDRLVSAPAIRAAAASIPGAELLMFPDAGHELLRERDEIRLAALARIDAFLDGHAA